MNPDSALATARHDALARTVQHSVDPAPQSASSWQSIGIAFVLLLCAVAVSMPLSTDAANACPNFYCDVYNLPAPDNPVALMGTCRDDHCLANGTTCKLECRDFFTPTFPDGGVWSVRQEFEEQQ
jgi:hypothetical protein